MLTFTCFCHKPQATKADVLSSHVNADDHKHPQQHIHTAFRQHANLTCPINRSSKARVPDRHSPRNQRVICPSRKGCARCAGVDRGVHKAACCICHLLVCMHDARLASRAGHLACTHIHTVARAVTVYRCTFCPPSCTSDMRACFAVRAVRSYRWNSWMRACICAFPCCACGSWWRCMYVHVYIREMRVLRLEGGTSGGVVDF
jgi:hypothetical protein